VEEQGPGLGIQVKAQGREQRYAIYSVLIIGTLLATRLALALLHSGYLGVDGGAYLLQIEGLFGLHLPQLDFARPPLAPGWLLVPFVHWFGQDVGYKVWSAIFSTLPLAPTFYLLARRFLSPKLALVALGVLAINPYDWQMFVTGSLPLIGFSFILLTIWGITGIARGTGTIWDKLAVAVSIALIPYINETSTGIAFIAIGTYLIALMLFTKSLQPLTKSLPYLFLGALLAAPALYWYGDVVPGGDRLSFPGPKVFISLGNAYGLLIVALGWYFGIGVLHSKGIAQNACFKALVIVLLVHSTLPIFWSYDESIINIFFRSANLAAILIVLVAIQYFAADAQRMHWTRRQLAVIASVFILTLGVGSIYTFNLQCRYSDQITPDMDEALQLIPHGQQANIITTNFMSGLWVAALNHSPTLWAFSANPPPMWQESYASTQCVFGWRTDCDPVAEAAKINARYILVDERFPHITNREPNLWGAPEDTWAPTNSAPWLHLLYSQGTVRLWEISWNGG
jgi:hypothetical protein